MKASDLMVGDWFKAVDYNSPFRITAIYDDVVQTQADYQSEIDGNWYSEAEIKDLIPIPLTEEILVKNGCLVCEHFKSCSIRAKIDTADACVLVCWDFELNKELMVE